MLGLQSLSGSLTTLTPQSGVLERVDRSLFPSHREPDLPTIALPTTAYCIVSLQRDRHTTSQVVKVESDTSKTEFKLKYPVLFHPIGI